MAALSETDPSFVDDLVLKQRWSRVHKDPSKSIKE